MRHRREQSTYGALKQPSRLWNLACRRTNESTPLTAGVTLERKRLRGEGIHVGRVSINPRAVRGGAFKHAATHALANELDRDGGRIGRHDPHVACVCVQLDAVGLDVRVVVHKPLVVKEGGGPYGERKCGDDQHAGGPPQPHEALCMRRRPPPLAHSLAGLFRVLEIEEVALPLLWCAALRHPPCWLLVGSGWQ
eukprot:scaffold252714_cov28-Tisochrysis_lutea.AAC.1